MGIEYKYNQIQSDILFLCDGTRTVEQIVNEFIKCSTIDNNESDNIKDIILKFIENEYRRNVFQLSDSPKRTNNMFGERGLYYPRELSIEITNKCNFHCPHCYKNAYNKGTDIDPDIMYNIYKKFKGKTYQIQFTGGEPFANKNIEKYINLFAQDFKVRIPTNGSLLSNVEKDTLKKLDFVQFSLYGIDDEEYELFTGYKNGYTQLMKSIDIIKKYNIEYIISVVLNKNRLQRLEEYVLAAYKLGASRIKFGVPTLVGRALDDLKNEKNYLLSSEDLKYAYRETRKLKSEYRGKISVAVWSHRGSGHEFKINTPPFDNLLPCGAGYTNFVISQSGLIRHCELLPEELFNMGSVDLFDDFIKGKYGDRLKNSVNNFNFELSKQGVGLDSICTPLKILYEKFKNDIN